MSCINTKFNYRKKFLKVLTEQNCELVDAGFQKFCSLGEGKAGRLLWCLTCDEMAIEATLKYLGLECVAAADVPLLRSELRYQYERGHKRCFETVDIDKRWEPAYTELVRHTDRIIAKAVLIQCKSTLKMKRRLVGKVLCLLNSEEERNYCGGMRRMGFSYAEARYLKPYKKYISELLLVMRGK